MPIVTADTGIVFPGLLSPQGVYGKLMVLFAVGKLQSELQLAEDEHQLIQAFLAENPEAEVGGPETGDSIEVANDRLYSLLEELPDDVPRDICLTTSPFILNELEEIAVTPRSRSAIAGLSEEEAQMVRRQLERLCVNVTPPFDPDAVFEHTQGRDRKDDPVVETAFLTNADWLVAKDKHIIRSHKRPEVYTHPVDGRELPAVKISYFLRNVVCPADSEFTEDAFNEIDGHLLEEAFAR